ncbi:MAG: cell wall-binding repeat-containing protein [Acidimicrobiaceae bacterium]|nr:cell wall-binding repeat-containing protein [Acidimicrobiaceae bacterium]
MTRARTHQVSKPRRAELGQAVPARATLAALACGALLAVSLPFGHAAAGAAAAEVEAERLAGPTRYETAVEIAVRYLAEIGGDTDSVIVTSGAEQHAACALSAAPLASVQRAPALLTEPDRLSLAPARFLRGADFSDVFIVGGTDEVSPAVAEQIRRLTGSTPHRLGGSGCAETALAVARHLGDAGVAAGRGRTALLATAAAAADGLAAGPVAYRGRFPLLFSDGTALNSDLAEFLDDHVDHVIILGGTAAVSARIENQVRLHVDSTERWAGADRYGTASRVALELLGAEGPVPCFDGDGVGLAAGFGAADAVASAPLLGERCDPLLLTERLRLSRETASVLASEAVTGDAEGRLVLAVFGGTAAVSSRVEAAAISAASAGRFDEGQPVFVVISAAEGACHWRVDFSEPVRTADAGDTGSYSFDGEPLPGRLAEVVVAEGPATRWAVILLAGASPYDAASVPIGCETPVAVRDRLGVNERSIRSTDGAAYNEGEELIVRSDTGRPQLKVLAALGRKTVWVRSNEALTDGTIRVTLTRGRSRLIETASVQRGDTGFRVSFDFPEHDSYGSTSLPFTQPPWLAPGDKISLAASKLRDRAGNANSAVTHTVAADTVPPRVSVVSLSQPVRRADGSAAVDVTLHWSEAVQGCGVGPADHTIDVGKLQVDGDGFADYSLDGAGTANAGVSLVGASDTSVWTRAGTAACDQTWRQSDGTLVARLAAPSAAMLPSAGSTLIARAGAAFDFAGNASQAHAAAFKREALDGR